ncbi:hypothetical protein [Actinoallomurus rhizosphaericola]|uniref:hypothetical protein n=1 Tax=Actinoallomurus rhizosphaericola TaxID=2952536 RepID=UPI00209224E8|nr:hypothetical protein [Actinoallomurus rhizosphaericola]MCO5998141.1 hypothetical protein [Actinoallomurus rhizosphaericola]
MTTHIAHRDSAIAAFVFLGGAIAVGVWTVLLGFYASAAVRPLWVGFDLLLVAGMALTGWLARRRDGRAALTAAGLAALMLADVWFDVMTARPAYRPTSIVMALTLELPFAAACAAFALRVRARTWR